MAGDREEIDVVVVGRAIYEKVRGELETTHKGKMWVVDVLSGDYEIGDDDLTTTLRLLERCPHALTWGELIGYAAPYRMGGRNLPTVGQSMLEKLRAEFGEPSAEW